MKKYLMLFLVLLLLLTMLVSCTVLSEEIDKNEDETLGESLQGDTVDVGDELVPINQDDCDNIEQSLSSEIKKAYIEFNNYHTTKPEELAIRFYCNIYGNHIVSFGKFVTCNMATRKVAGYLLTYGNGAIYYVYKDSKFYTINEAYDNDILSKEGVYQFAIESGAKIEEIKE